MMCDVWCVVYDVCKLMRVICLYLVCTCYSKAKNKTLLSLQNLLQVVHIMLSLALIVRDEALTKKDNAVASLLKSILDSTLIMCDAHDALAVDALHDALLQDGLATSEDLQLPFFQFAQELVAGHSKQVCSIWREEIFLKKKKRKELLFGKY